MKSQASVILDGRQAAKKHLEALAKEIERLQAPICLGTIQVGESKDAALYSRAMDRLLKSLGLVHEAHVFPENVSEKELLATIEKLNREPKITGILIFEPLPERLNGSRLLDAVNLHKDVEGCRYLLGSKERVVTPTAMAAVALVEEAGVPLQGLEAVVIGRSLVVGRPAALLLLDRDATVTICHSHTRDLKSHIEKADIVIAAVGKANLVKGAWIKPGAIVVDVGENVVDGKPVGDVEFEAAAGRAGFITPVPGGVGPLTNVMLVKNLLTLWKSSKS